MNVCREIFRNKTIDYGTSWRILRPSSLTDQIFIKANRIRTIQDMGENKIRREFRRCIFLHSQLLRNDICAPRYKFDFEQDELTSEKALEWYDAVFKEAFELMESKNHDYGEAWRDMRVSSLTDLILTKILRIKKIEDNSGKTIASEVWKEIILI